MGPPGVNAKATARAPERNVQSALNRLDLCTKVKTSAIGAANKPLK